MARDKGARLGAPARRQRSPLDGDPAAVAKEIGADPWTAAVASLRSALDRLPRARIEEVAKRANRLLDFRKHVADEQARVALVKVLVAAFPSSAPLIEHRLSNQDGR